MVIDGRFIKGEGYRISVLTNRLLRLEYSESNRFTDAKTLNVINRDFPVVDFNCWEENGVIHIETGELSVVYSQGPFTANDFVLTLKNGTVWNYGNNYIDETGNLLGTARTLDNSDGPVDMEKGLFSRKGISLLDDSKTPLLINDEVENRSFDQVDAYVFCYGVDFSQGLKDFSILTGKTPMIPRYALGNWWSKYERYTQESYIKLLDDFKKENIPLSVGVIDMDWHVTDIDPKYGHGWTGFTWNKELFYDYKKFLSDIHERGLAVTLNLHPADGIRKCEEMFDDVAMEMGIDPDETDAIPFDLTSESFRRGYFNKVLHPYEDAGVDFWWIDWQQGTKMGKTDADPLWLNNHYHFVDQENRDKRAMIFSRFAGWGSHRYPIGFSGDTKTTWRSLEFQPWFTSTASNIAYGWWSHDIGGHMLGDRDDERLVRWIQFGVFSPIMRLHSSNSPFFVKEPWKQAEPYRSIIGKYMIFRHRMIPYLYTMNYLAWKDDMPLIRPMYYENSEDRRSYEVPHEYMFGNALVVGAITSPCDTKTRMGYATMYLPDGEYYDIFTGNKYTGKVKRNVYRNIENIPVLLKSGEILPLSGEECLDANANPETIDLYVAFGSDAQGILYEDDGTTNLYRVGEASITAFDAKFDAKSNNLTISIKSVNDNRSYVPENRKYRLHVLGAHGEKHSFSYDLGLVGKEDATFTIDNIQGEIYSYKDEVFEILVDAWIDNITKDRVNHMLNSMEKEEFIASIKEMDIDLSLKDAILGIC